jgi:hypothetical protein
MALGSKLVHMHMPSPLPDPPEEDVVWDLAFDLDDEAMFQLLLPPDMALEDRVALDALFDQGFTWDQGLRLLALRHHLFDIPEMRERIAADPHLHFARWLYAHGHLSG